MLRLVHTADWHLGHSLHGVSREFEHARFLGWLLDTLASVTADALVVAGDIFDSANPPAAAQTQFYRFLRDAKLRQPHLDIVLVAGNHDSAARLAAPSALLEAFDIRVVGGLPRDADGDIDWEPLVVPLHDREGRVAAWCGAMPFLRNADLPPLNPDAAADPLIGGVKARYDDLLDVLRARRDNDAALVMTGHCYMTGTRLSELSERKILGGNQHALPAGIFPGDVDYVALGHLHLAQQVGGREHVRYSGSPIPLSLDEAGYPHQVLQVDLAAPGKCAVTPLRVPRAVEILRVPAKGAVALDEAIAALAALDVQDSGQPETRPFVEVRLLLDRPEPGLRQRLDEALADKPLRLLKVGTAYTGSGEALGDAVLAVQLDELAPDEVFARRYAQSFEEEPPGELVAAFHELVDGVRETD